MKKILVILSSLLIFAGCAGSFEDMETTFTEFFDSVEESGYVYTFDDNTNNMILDFESKEEHTVKLENGGVETSYVCSAKKGNTITSEGETYEMPDTSLCEDQDTLTTASYTKDLMYQVGFFDSGYDIDYEEEDGYYVAHGVNDEGVDFSLKVFKDGKKIEYKEGEGSLTIEAK